MRLPSERDINVYNTLDEIVARDHFLNKTLEEAEALFRDNSAEYQEDLMWMGPRAFAFYIHAALNCLRSEASASDDHFVSCLLGTINLRSSEEPSLVASDAVQQLVSYVLESYDKFAVDESVYGALRQEYARLKQR